MRLKTATKPKPFTPIDIANKELIVQMLKFEDSIMLGEKGKAIFADKTIPHLTSLDAYYMFHRMALARFGFTTTDDDIVTYRTIFMSYYKGPHDYDADVLGSVCYMRQNKCVYYDAPLIEIGDDAPDVDLLTLDGTPTTFHSLLHNPHRYVFVGAFSNS